MAALRRRTRRPRLVRPLLSFRSCSLGAKATAPRSRVRAVLAQVRQHARVGICSTPGRRRVLPLDRRGHRQPPWSTLTGGLISSNRRTRSAVSRAAWIVASGPARGRTRRQSTNTLVTIIDDRLVLKSFRRPCRGVDPEIEIGRFLTEVAPFPHCRARRRHRPASSRRRYADRGRDAADRGPEPGRRLEPDPRASRSLPRESAAARRRRERVRPCQR